METPVIVAYFLVSFISLLITAAIFAWAFGAKKLLKHQMAQTQLLMIIAASVNSDKPLSEDQYGALNNIAKRFGVDEDIRLFGDNTPKETVIVKKDILD